MLRYKEKYLLGKLYNKADVEKNNMMQVVRQEM